MITIITPVFNSGRFIETCIESVSKQAFPGLEHLIVDGGSTDKTLEIVKEKAKIYSHLNWISEKDWGQSDAMNKGLLLAHNPVVSFLNADDFYEPGALEFAAGFFLNAPKNSFLVGMCRVLREDGSEYMINDPRPFDPVSFRLDYNFPFNPSAYFYHKSLHDFVGLYDVEDHLTMDIDFILRLMPVASISYCHRILGNYVMVATSKTMQEISGGRNVENLERIFDKHYNKLSVFQKVNLKFQKLLGKNRGWIMHYVHNPKALWRKLLGKSG